MSDLADQVTELLGQWNRGDPQGREAVVQLVYKELRRLAGSYLRRERADHTLQPTALVHEAYLRLAEQKNVQFQDRGHFFAITAQLMRRILVDHARGHVADKRGGGAAKVAITEAVIMSQERPEEFLALDEALTRLTQLDPQQARVVELRIFGGLTVEEAAEVLGISPATVKRDWSMAKTWLLQQLQRAENSREP